MPDPISIARLLDSLEPRLRQTQDAPPDQLRELLGEASRALHAAVGELREARQSLVSARGGDSSSSGEAGAFRMLFASSPDALLLTGADGVIRHANSAAGALLGVRREDLAGTALDSFVAETGPASVRDVLAMLRGSIEPRRVTLQLRPRRRLPLRVEAAAWACAADDAAIAWSFRVPAADEGTAVGGDAAALRALVDSLPAAAAAMDLDGTVLTWNRAAQRLLGWTEDELAGRPNPAIGEELLNLLDAMRSAGPEAEPCHARAEAARRGGGLLAVELELAPLADAGGAVTGTVALMRPVDESAPSDSASGDRRQPWSVGELRRVLLHPSGRTAFADRLRAGVAAGVHTGHLRTGDRLPSIREAAQESGTDHRVVSSAYQRLAGEGLVEIRNRRGVVVAPLPRPHGPELNETAEWLAKVLEEASELQVRVPSLPDLVRRWTATATLDCLCVDATEDARLALTHEMSHQWGMRATAAPVDDSGDPAARHALAEAMRAADLVVTTPFHAHVVRPVAESLGKPLVIATANPEMVGTIEARLRRGPVAAVLADASYGDRLRALEGGEGIVVIPAGDAEAVAALDPAEPVIATLAALRRISAPLRLLVPATHFVSPISARAIARVLIGANVNAGRVHGE
ncbi:PAS domain S-box protein [Longimicrobium sp.]|uniref:PAS domain S-box protein n=1 Tax=Longimicrobium sp. TaxID=2029185 RepID=UPI002BBB18FF|nr:PAS domain S-box protein [Longimicrobium sp.]HSU13786.1 PAS domain S-box protein [Longimicrobium sp.]